MLYHANLSYINARSCPRSTNPMAATRQEAISSIRTVVAFGGEKKECKRYESKVEEAMDTSIESGIG